MATLPKSIEHQQGRSNLQGTITAPPDQLEDLGNKLDLSDTAGPQLDVLDTVFTCDFLTNLSMQCTHGIDCTKIQIFAKDKRSCDSGGHGRRTGKVCIIHHPGFNPGVALPFSALRNEVGFQHVA